MELREEIRRYEPFNEQEREDKEEILRQMETDRPYPDQGQLERNPYHGRLCMDHGLDRKRS